MKTQKIELINNRTMLIEIEENNQTESVKTYITDKDGNVELDSVRITCTCGGKSVTKTCSKDGYCDCTGDSPKVVCT
jgi:hypothetical protein